MGMSTQPSSPFDDSLSWDFNAYDVGEEVNLDNEILTALVRTSYLKHLQRSLSDNYGLWMEKNLENDDLSEVGINDIVKCAKFLEHKALRACMVTSYYQRAMVRTMKEIKRSTEEGSIFGPLIEQVFDNKCVKTKTVCDKETQTNISLISYKTNECPMATQEKVIQPSLDISTENSNLIIINPRNDIVPDQENADAIEDLFNILMHSPSISENSNFHSPKKRKIREDSNFCNGQSNKLLEKSTKSLTSLKSNTSPSFQSNLHYIKANPPEFKTVLPTDNVPSNISLLLNNSLEESCPLNLKSELYVTPEKKSNLDERLKSLAALFGEDPHSPKGTIENNNELSENVSDMSVSDENSMRNKSFSLPLDWRAEYAAQMCHLKMILSRMSSVKRQNIRRLFKRIFGSDSSLHTYISNNEEALSRKRIANIVVSSLTPHYIGGKIASRDIFKALAKNITDEFLLLSYVAGHDEIAKKVNSYFDNGKCINSVKDFHEFSYH